MLPGRRAFGSMRLVIGVVLLGVVVGAAMIGPLVAPHSPTQPVGVPGSPPSPRALLGTDFLGRDVLSRVLHGGWPVLWVAAVSTVLTYTLGIVVGMVAALAERWTDAILMRVVDLLIVFPPLLLLLVLIAGAGTSAWILIGGTVLVLFPGVARIVRSATLGVAVSGYIEAAVARGERIFALMRREILPNIMPVVVADAGLRFLGAIFLVASLNFLGVGASQPPSANWGLMIAENRGVMVLNIWAVLAPALLLGLLTVSVNLIGDAYARKRDNPRYQS